VERVLVVRKVLLTETRDRTGPHHGGEERRKTEEVWAERRLAEANQRASWTERPLPGRWKADVVKGRLGSLQIGTLPGTRAP